MGKLEQYAKQLKAKKAKAKAFMATYEALGFTFSDALKASANEPTPDRITKKTLQSSYNVDLRRLMGHIAKQRPRQKVDLILHNPETGNALTNGQFKLNVTPKTIADMNSNLQNLKSYKPMDKIYQAIYRDFYNRLGALPAPGKRIETKDYILTEGWDASNIAQHLQFKKTADFNQGYIQDILNVPQTTSKGKELFNADWHHRSFTSNVDKLLSKDGSPISSLTRGQINALESIMNTSEAWNIAKKDAKPSGQDDDAQDRWSKLYKAVADVKGSGNNDALDKVLSMIDNEEDFEDILDYVNDIIGG